MAKLKDALKALGSQRLAQCERIAAAHDVDYVTLLALAWIESGLQNVVGGEAAQSNGTKEPIGSRRGLWQLDEDRHRAFLTSVPGCRSGSYVPDDLHPAVDEGYVPQFRTSCDYVAGLLEDFAEATNATADSRVVIASFNVGVTQALAGLEEGDVDRRTTLGDYSTRVGEAQDAIRKELK